MRSSKRSLSQNFYQLIPSRFPPIEVYARLGDTDVKEVGIKLYELMELHGNGREISIAKTKLEEAVMWAVKGMTK